MPAAAPHPHPNALLASWRRSVLGAWLAVAYALAVLAAALTPTQAGVMMPGAYGVLLCSGLAVPDDGAPADSGRTDHCKGCPANPVPAGAVPQAALAPVRHGATVVAVAIPASWASPGRSAGLPQPRGPPAGTSRF